MNTPAIHIRGARTHNLRNIDVDFPVGQLTVVTGLSGSGKSSLTRDTMFAEGQRRYLESVAVQTHQLIRSLRRPDVDAVSGLPPTISIDQRVHHVPARSTVAVTAGIHDYLRLLYARCGVVHCTSCNRPVQCQTVGDIVQRVLSFPERSKFMVLAPLVRDRRGAHADVLERVERHGLVRVRVDGRLFDLSELPQLDAAESHRIDAVIDRLILRDGIESRLHESVALAVRESGDACIVCLQTDADWEDHYYNTRHSCAACELSFPEPDPGLFSFASGRGACPVCEGLGVRGVVEEQGDTTVFRAKPCTSCGGSRLQDLPARVRFGIHTLPEFTALSVAGALDVVQRWEELLMKEDRPASAPFAIRMESRAAARRIVPDITRRLVSLTRVGLGYLTLNRSTQSLSGGEYQRTRLASCLGTDVHGACYLLDEPFSGLHPQDTQRLLSILGELRSAGATVVVVEHDPDVVRAADHVIEIGPGAGSAGGALLYAGPPSKIPADTPTGRMLADQSQPAAVSRTATADQPHREITVRGAALHNLQNVTVSIPLGQFVCVTGVSGSGKSSLITGTLVPVAEASCQATARTAAVLADVECQAIDGLSEIDRVVLADGRAVSRNRRSCVATHSGVWNDIRRLLSRTRAARAQGIRAARFSFNSGSGRCAECKGTGVQEIRMSLLPDAEVPCSVCGGRRFRSDILSIRYSGRTVNDILNLSVGEALEAFSQIDSVVRRLRPFEQVGLGYLTLGQSASTFSGGEAQRVRLATELAETSAGSTLYVLDEPTRGLHAADVQRLLSVLRGFVDRGHSVIVIEHSMQVVRSADWIIDMGPGPAASGGTLVADGTPAALRRNPRSVTGRWI